MSQKINDTVEKIQTWATAHNLDSRVHFSASSQSAYVTVDCKYMIRISDHAECYSPDPTIEQQWSIDPDGMTYSQTMTALAKATGGKFPFKAVKIRPETLVKQGFCVVCHANGRGKVVATKFISASAAYCGGCW